MRGALDTSEPQDTRNILFAIALVMGFVFLVSVAIYVIRERYGLQCGCAISLPIVIAVLTSLGVLVGILTYAFISKAYQKKHTLVREALEKTLSFLDAEEQRIVKTLLQHQGALPQNTLRSKTNLDAVKLHRRLRSLESRNIIHKEKNGMTNTVRLDAQLRQLFLR